MLTTHNRLQEYHYCLHFLLECRWYQGKLRMCVWFFTYEVLLFIRSQYLRLVSCISDIICSGSVLSRNYIHIYVQINVFLNSCHSSVKRESIIRQGGPKTPQCGICVYSINNYILKNLTARRLQQRYAATEEQVKTAYGFFLLHILCCNLISASLCVHFLFSSIVTYNPASTPTPFLLILTQKFYLRFTSLLTYVRLYVYVCGCVTGYFICPYCLISYFVLFSTFCRRCQCQWDKTSNANENKNI